MIINVIYVSRVNVLELIFFGNSVFLKKFIEINAYKILMKVVVKGFFKMILIYLYYFYEIS